MGRVTVNKKQIQNELLEFTKKAKVILTDEQLEVVVEFTAQKLQGKVATN